MSNTATGYRLIWVGVVLLIILRQDSWFWNDATLVLGILPIGLAWQIGISIAAAVLWFAASLIAWPANQLPPLPPSSDEPTEASS